MTERGSVCELFAPGDLPWDVTTTVYDIAGVVAWIHTEAMKAGICVKCGVPRSLHPTVTCAAAL